MEGSQLWYKLHIPHGSCTVCETLGVTRLRPVTPRYVTYTTASFGSINHLEVTEYLQEITLYFQKSNKFDFKSNASTCTDFNKHYSRKIIIPNVDTKRNYTYLESCKNDILNGIIHIVFLTIRHCDYLSI